MAPIAGLLLVLVVLAHVAGAHRTDHNDQRVDDQRNARVLPCLLVFLLAAGFALTALALLLALTLLTTKGGP